MIDEYRLMVRSLLVVTISTFHVHIALATECPSLKTCEDFKSERIETNGSSNIADWDNITDEIAIGRQGHWEGIVPVFYQVKLNFSNGTHYTGSVNITINIVQDTDRVLINHDDSFGGLDYKSISITQDCSKATQELNGCICSASFSMAHGTLGLKLLGAKLRKGNEYILSIDFYGRSRSRTKPGEGRYNEGLDDTREAGAFSLSATLQMRQAREVFPCFDHPRLKAKFQLCMEYPSYMMAASNTPVRGDPKVDNDRKEECFEETPLMSTYLFTFALMENYTSESVVVPDRNLTIELFAPITTIDEFRHVFNESIRTVEYMESVTKFPYPLSRLAYIVVYTVSESSMENFGLIKLWDMTNTQETPGTITILVHETMHQWFGNLATVTDWSHICLQEGLTLYYNWKIETYVKSDSKYNTPTPHYYESYIRHFPTLSHVRQCFFPSYFFYALDVWDGQDSLNAMVQILLQKYAYKSAGLTEWNEALDEAFTNNVGELRGYLKAYMTPPGPVSLLAWHTTPSIDQWDTNGTCIKVRQLIGNLTVQPRPVPVILHTFSAHGVELKQSKLVLTKQDQIICSLQGPAFLISPNIYLPYYKHYGLKNYYHLMKGWDNTFIGKYGPEWIVWFCESFLRDELPMAEEPWGFSKEVLVDFMNTARDVVGKTITILHIFEMCDCCLASNKTLVEKINSCSKNDWKEECSGLRLVKQVFN